MTENAIESVNSDTETHPKRTRNRKRTTNRFNPRYLQRATTVGIAPNNPMERFRWELGIGLSEMANRLGISRQLLHQYEFSMSYPSRQLWEQMVESGKAHGIDLTEELYRQIEEDREKGKQLRKQVRHAAVKEIAEQQINERRDLIQIVRERFSKRYDQKFKVRPEAFTPFEELRFVLKLTPDEWATRLMIAPSRLYCFERGDNNVPVSVAKRMQDEARKLGVVVLLDELYQHIVPHGGKKEIT